MGDETAQTAFFSAVAAGDLAASQQALTAGADPNRPLPAGPPPLIWAAQRDKRDLTRQLLLAGANPDSTDKDGETALTWAAHHGHTAIVKDLLAVGAAREARGRKHQATPLGIAAARGQRGIVALLATTAAVDAPGPGGKSPLLMLLDAYPATVRPLERVRQIAKTLVDAGANPALTDELGRSAAAIAQKLGDEYLLALLT